MSSPETILLSELSKYAARRLFAWLDAEHGASEQDEEKVALKLHRHLRLVANWTDRLEFYGLSTASTTEASTVPLKFSSTERRFRPAGTSDGDLREDDLLVSNSHYVLIGAPGTGKTTTIKRLAKKVLLDPPAGTGDKANCPIVIRLREHNLGLSTLAEVVADSLSISYVRQNVEYFDQDKYNREKSDQEQTLAKLYESIEARQSEIRMLQEKLQDDLPEAEASRLTRQLRHSENLLRDAEQQVVLHSRESDEDLVKRATVTHQVASFDGERLDEVIPEVLDRLGALVFVDGLDEVPAEVRTRLDQELSRIASKLSFARIMASCREGDYRELEFFDTVQLCPLDEFQVRSIAERWIDDADSFIEKLREVPYGDLADRPLFLAYLLVIFKNLEELPSQPADVYKRIVWLMLRDWDEQRRIKRKSRYGNFYPERKLEFLSALAFHLILSQQKRIFSQEDLLDAYGEMHLRFGLPQEEALEVVREVQSHTGLISEVGFDSFEFSHASLQEYLAGSYLVRTPRLEDRSEYLNVYPAPFAVAAALSPEAGDWLARLILSYDRSEIGDRATASLLSRFAQEQPVLSKESYLGYALLAVLFDYGEGLFEEVRRIATLPGATEALRTALGSYVLKKSADGEIFFDYGPSYGSREAQRVTAWLRSGSSVPNGGTLPAELVSNLSSSLAMRFEGTEYGVGRLVVE